MQNFQTRFNVLPPSGVTEALHTLRETGISFYIHGGPGISKSSVVKQFANSLDIAFIDFRLSQVQPEDIRGIPMPADLGHIKGVIWTPPLIFPRDLDVDLSGDIDTSGSRTFFFHNPCGDNGIPYCQPTVEVQVAAGADVVASVETIVDRCTVRLTDANGQPCTGHVRLRITGKARAVLALEEFNSAPPSVMAASYQLILDRRIGDYVVPDDVMIVALGNRDSDRGVTHELAKPVANRFVHVEMDFSWDNWLSWAVQNDIHPLVIGFLSKWQTKVNDFDPDSPDLAFPTPRTWEFVSKILHAERQPSDTVLRAIICGAIGDAVGNEFVQHRKFMADMPAIGDILSGAVTTFQVRNSTYELQIAYSICVQMCYELRKRYEAIEQTIGRGSNARNHPARQQWLAEADRGFTYAINNFRPDIAIMATRLATIEHKLKLSPAQMPRLNEFLNRNAAAVL